MKAGNAYYPLYFYDRQPDHLLTGARIRVRGIRIDSMLALGGNSKDVQTVAAAPVPNALGAQKTLLILVKFQDTVTEPYSVAEARSMMFDTTSAFFMENSYQQTWLSGDVYGWYTIPLDSTNCDINAIESYAEAAAVAAGARLSAYTHYVYAFPDNSGCGWWGLSTVGGNPSRAWITREFQLGVTAHELGHGLGLLHSHMIDCGPGSIGANCTPYEYGDRVDMIGGSNGHFNAFQKERLGWLNAGASPPITTVKTDGTYILDTYEVPGLNPKALKIPKSADPYTGKLTWYYV
ncbi:peptidase M11, partial [bacterium]|nr:peptidase M11 [bacterium]